MSKKYFSKHQEQLKGDFSLFESLLPQNIKVQHMDSYNHPEIGMRFQGSFYYRNGATCHEAPLSILNLAKKYMMNICYCNNTHHIVWTIWF